MKFFRSVTSAWKRDADQQPGNNASRSASDKLGGIQKPPSKNHRFSIVLPVYRTSPRLLRSAILSILNQTFLPVEIIIIDDSGQKSRLDKVVAKLPDPGRIIRYIKNTENLGISGATNVAVRLATGDFLFFVDHDDELEINALACFADAMESQPENDVWYSDQYTIDEAGQMKHHFLKPVWSPTYFLGAMYIGHLLAARATFCKEILFRSEFDGVQDYDFLIRMSEKTHRIGHVPHMLYKWRAVDGSVAKGVDEKHGIDLLQESVVNQHLIRSNKTWLAESHPSLPHRLVLLPSIATQEPRISIIIPSRNQGEILDRCLDSVFCMTDYDNYEVIVVDNR